MTQQIADDAMMLGLSESWGRSDGSGAGGGGGGCTSLIATPDGASPASGNFDWNAGRVTFSFVGSHP